MDARAVWELILGAVGLLGSAAFNLWYIGYKVGKIRGADVQKIRDLTAIITRIDAAQDKQSNQNLRIFQAIEELRRRLGNGDREWSSLIGE